MAEESIKDFGEIFICPDMKSAETGENEEIFLQHKELVHTHSIFKMIIREVKCTDTPEIIAARKKYIDDLEVSSF